MTWTPQPINWTPWSKPTTSSTQWNNASEPHSAWNPDQIYNFLTTEAGDILETEGQAAIILENQRVIDWSKPSTNATIWT